MSCWRFAPMVLMVRTNGAGRYLFNKSTLVIPNLKTVGDRWGCLSYGWGCVKIDISSFFEEKVNPFREKGQPFLWKRSTLSVKKVNPFCEKGQPFLWKRSTLSVKKVNPFWKNSRLSLKIGRLFWEKLLTLFVDGISFRNKKRGCVYFDTPSFFHFLCFYWPELRSSLGSEISRLRARSALRLFILRCASAFCFVMAAGFCL